MKITIIGGGSYLWTPHLIGDVLLSNKLKNVEIFLFDINERNLKDMETFSNMMERYFQTGTVIKSTMNIVQALEGADFVIIQIAVGGFDAMKYDLEIPAKYGLYQSVGDTVGPGGISRGIRNAPILTDYAIRMKELCPSAWMINLTNPLTILTRIVSKLGVKVIGLCHEVSESIERISKLFEMNPNDYIYDVIGINHLPWITSMNIDGKDGLSLLKRYIQSRKYDRVFLSDSDDPFLSKMQVAKELFETFDSFPAASDRHIAEFFPYFLRDVNFTKVEGKYRVRLTTIGDREIRRKNKIKFYENLLKEGPKVFEKSYKIKRSKESVVDVISALYHKENAEFVVDVPNDGTIENVPVNSVIETKAALKNGKIKILTPKHLTQNVLGTFINHIMNQEEIVESILEKDKKRAFSAFLNDPLTSNLSLDKIKLMFRELWKFSADEKWLQPPYHIGKYHA